MARPAEDRFDTQDLMQAIKQMEINAETPSNNLEFNEGKQEEEIEQEENTEKKEEAKQETKEEETKETGEKEVKAGEKESEEKKKEAKELTDEELENTFMTTKVYGVEKKVNLKEVRDSHQIGEATREKLDEVKALAHELKMEKLEISRMKAELEARKTNPAANSSGSEEYIDPITAQINQFRAEMDEIKGQTTAQIRVQLQAKEDAELQKIVGEEKPEIVQAKILQVIEENPRFRPVAARLFNGSPRTQEEMADRIAFFDALWTKAQAVDLNRNMPKIVQQVKEEGKREAKKAMKQNLVTVDGGKNDSSDLDESVKKDLHKIRTVRDAATFLEKRSKIFNNP